MAVHNSAALPTPTTHRSTAIAVPENTLVPATIASDSASATWSLAGPSAFAQRASASLAPLPPLPSPWTRPVLIAQGQHSDLFEVLEGTDGPARVLKVSRAGGPRAGRAAIRREAGFLRALALDGVPQLLAELTFDDGRPAIVMDRAPGIHLADWRRRIGRVPASAAVAVIRDAAVVLERVHLTGIIHGEVRPEHIFRDVQGRVTLVDWGQAGQHDSRRGPQHGAPGGFSPPEHQDHPTALLSPTADVWGLTASMFQTIAGVLPPPIAGTPANTRFSLPKDPMLVGIAGNLLRAIIARGLEPDPTRRIPTVAGLRAELSGWLAAFGQAPTTAGPL